MNQEEFDRAVGEFALAIGLLFRRVRAAQSSDDLSLTERSVLARLHKSGPATISDLARAESVRPQSMGATVVALEEMELIERQPHPTDGRQVNIVATEAARRLVERTKATNRTWLAKTIAGLSATDRDTLFRAAEIIKGFGEQ